MTLSRSSLFSTRFKPRLNRNRSLERVQRRKLLVFPLRWNSPPPRPEPWKVENLILTFCLLAPCSRSLLLRRLWSTVSLQRRSRRERPRPKELGPRNRPRPNYSDGAVIARCRRRRSGGPVQWEQKPFATRAGFGISPVGFSPSIDRPVAPPSAAKFTPIVTGRCWR